MSEYIKREDAVRAIAEALDEIDHVPDWVYNTLYAHIDKTPDANVRPVVMCKDCEYSRFCAQYIEVHGKYYHIDYCSGSEHSKVKK